MEGWVRGGDYEDVRYDVLDGIAAPWRMVALGSGAAVCSFHTVKFVDELMMASAVNSP